MDNNNFLDRVKYFIGIDDAYEDEYYDDYEANKYEPNEHLEGDTTQKRLSQSSNNLHTNATMTVIVHEPLNYDEAPMIIDDLKRRKTVVVNLEQLQTDVKKQIFDFLNGGIYALEGNIQRVTKDIFVLAPNNVEIDGLKDELKSKGIFSW